MSFPTEVLKIRRRVERLEQMRRTAREDYNSSMKEYYTQLKHLQDSCPHPEYDWELDGAGHNNIKTCKVCGK